MLWDGYDFTSQFVSELSAIGAPSRPLVVPLFIIYDVLFLAFGWGVWRLSVQKRALRVTAGLLVGYGVISFVAVFFPMHPRGTEVMFTDIMHATIDRSIGAFVDIPNWIDRLVLWQNLGFNYSNSI